jgi:hypothetical protein
MLFVEKVANMFSRVGEETAKNLPQAQVTSHGARKCRQAS